MTTVIELLKVLLIEKAHALPSGISDAGCSFATGDAHFACIPVYIKQLTFIVVSLAASISLLLLIANGFRYMVMPAIGESSDAAKKGILYAIIGLCVSLLSYIILDTIVCSVTGGC